MCCRWPTTRCATACAWKTSSGAARTGLVYALGAVRIPDPTTADDFCRRFTRPHIAALHEAIDAPRRNVWAQQLAAVFDEARIDADGTLVVNDFARVADQEPPRALGGIDRGQSVESELGRTVPTPNRLPAPSSPAVRKGRWRAWRWSGRPRRWAYSEQMNGSASRPPWATRSARTRRGPPTCPRPARAERGDSGRPRLSRHEFAPAF